MWTLSQARTRLGHRLAEESATPVFWSTTERDNAINDAQRFIAGVTRGVPLTLTGSVDATTPYLTVTGRLVGEYAAAGRVDGGRSLTYVSREQADKGFPTWTSFVGVPRWVIVSPAENRIYLAPVQAAPTNVTVRVSVLPADMVADGTPLFGDVAVMEKYQGALLNLAAAYLLLKERYDGDAERFYQLAIQELQSLGIAPADIPPRPEVTSG